MNMKSGVLPSLTWIMIMHCFFLSVIKTEAQEKQVFHQNQQWLEYTARLKMSDNYTIVADGGLRWLDNYTTGTFYYVRAGLEYKCND